MSAMFTIDPSAQTSCNKIHSCLYCILIKFVLNLYSETPLNRTPLGQMKMFTLEGFQISEVSHISQIANIALLKLL